VGEPGADEGTVGTDSGGAPNDNVDILLAVSGPLAVERVGEAKPGGDKTGDEAAEAEAKD
jgi:hypothetical protein